MLLSASEDKHWITNIEKDPSGLGRWVWSKYSSRRGVNLRAISSYLCRNREGPESVYNQQRRYLREINNTRSP